MRRFGARVLVVAGAVATVAAGALPWLQSGARRRSAYELAEIANRLDAVPGVVQNVVVRGFVCVPLLLAVAVVLVLLHRFRAAMVVAAPAVMATFALAISLLIVEIPPIVGVPLKTGSILAVIGATLMAFGLVLARHGSRAH